MFNFSVVMTWTAIQTRSYWVHWEYIDHIIASCRDSGPQDLTAVSSCIHTVVSKMQPHLLSVAYICLYHHHHHHRGAQRLFTTLTFANRSPTQRGTHSRPSARYSDNFTFSSSVKSILSGGRILGVLIFLCVSNLLLKPVDNAIVAFIYFFGFNLFYFLNIKIMFMHFLQFFSHVFAVAKTKLSWKTKNFTYFFFLITFHLTFFFFFFIKNWLHFLFHVVTDC